MDEDAARFERVQACVDLIGKGNVRTLADLVSVCLPDMDPDPGQFDVLCDSWDAFQAIERNRREQA